MKYQPKVNKTRNYSDKQGEHIVTEGKLLLLNPDIKGFMQDINKKQDFIEFYHDNDGPPDVTCLKPIIISETEEIKKGDRFVKWNWKDAKPYIHLADKSNESMWNLNSRYYDSDEYDPYKAKKILALPEHFSNEHLQAIVDGELKDGDEVFIRIQENFEGEMNGPIYSYSIHLDQQNHITLFPAKQSLEEAANTYLSYWRSRNANLANITQAERMLNSFKAGAEWAKKNSP